MTKQRILWLDNLKGLLIIMVVLGHCIQHTLPDYADNVVFRYIYSFHMMLFMFVSGYACYRTRVEWSLWGKRAKQLLLPFLVWSLVTCAIRGEFQLGEMILYPEKSFWFLWVLFFITQFHVIACRLASRWRLKDEWTSLGMGLLLLGFTAITRINLFGLQLIAFHYVFYMLGFYAHKYNMVERVHSWLMVTSLFCWFVMAWFWSVGRPVHQLNYSNPVFTTIIHYMVAMTAIVAFMPLAFKFLNCKQLVLSEIGGGHISYLCHSPFTIINNAGLVKRMFYFYSNLVLHNNSNYNNICIQLYDISLIADKQNYIIGVSGKIK